MAQFQGGDGEHRDAALLDEEGVLVGSMKTAAILHDSQAACGKLVVDTVVQQDDAIRNVLFEPVAAEIAVAAFRRNHGGDAALFKPAKQAAHFGAQNSDVGKSREQRLQGIEHNALGSHRLDGMLQANEEAFQVVFASLLDFAALDVNEIEE